MQRSSSELEPGDGPLAVDVSSVSINSMDQWGSLGLLTDVWESLWKTFSLRLLHTLMLLSHACYVTVWSKMVTKYCFSTRASAVPNAKLLPRYCFLYVQKFPTLQENVKTVILRGCTLPTETFNFLGNLLNLQELDLASCPGQVGMNYTFLKNLANLRSLGLSATPMSDAELPNLSGLTHLQILDLSYSQCTGMSLSCLQALTNLEDLNFQKTRMRAPSLEALSPLTNLKALKLSGIQGSVLTHVFHFTKLTYLNLYDCSVGNEDVANIKDLTRLKTLNLSFSKITDVGLKSLDGLVNLTELNLYGSKGITPMAIEEFKIRMPNRITITVKQKWTGTV